MPRSLSAHQQREDVVDLGMRQAGHGFVGDQQLRLGRHGARELELAHFDLGQIARHLLGLVGEADQLEQLDAARVEVAVRVQMPARRACTV